MRVACTSLAPFSSSAPLVDTARRPLTKRQGLIATLSRLLAVTYAVIACVSCLVSGTAQGGEDLADNA